jgi:hypothetical protein
VRVVARAHEVRVAAAQAQEQEGAGAMDPVEIRKLEAEVRRCLDARGRRPVPRVYVPPWSEATPTEELLRLLNTLLGFSANCTNHSKTLAYAWNNAVRVQLALASQKRTVAGSRVLEIGAGVHSPLGSSLVLLALGAAACASNDFSPVEDPVDAAETTLRVFVEICGALPEGAARLAGVLDTDLLASGRLQEAIRGTALTYDVCPVADLGAERPFDVIHSNAVVEHFLDMDAAVATLARLTAPGGVHVHKVDFVDHEFYNCASPTATTPFEFLFVQNAGPVGTTNRLRLSQVVAAFERHGLHLLTTSELSRSAFPVGERGRLAPQFRDLSSDDLDTICAVLVFGKDWRS